MRDTFNIVKVSDIDDVDCQKIIKTCVDKPNLINYYYPHIFMNRDKIDKIELLKICNEFIKNIKREKNIDHTIKKYNTITNIIDTLFLCVLELENVKDIHKFIKYDFSKNENIIIDITNCIIKNTNLYNLEQILSDKIDQSYCVFIIQHIVDHIKKQYNYDNLEKTILTQHKLLDNVQTYLTKLKYNPQIIKILNCNKLMLIEEYVNKCEITDNHDLYIPNIINLYFETVSNKNNTNNELIDNVDWQLYFKKIHNSLVSKNITKDDVIKSILRLTILDKVIEHKRKEMKEIKLVELIHNMIENQKIDVYIINSYTSMIKQQVIPEKIQYLETIIKYFPNYNLLTREMIKIVLPKYFSKSCMKYYLDCIERINRFNHKLSVIDNIILMQKEYTTKLEHDVFISNTSEHKFDENHLIEVNNDGKKLLKFKSNLVSFFSVDNKHIDDKSYTGSITKYNHQLIGYTTFANKFFKDEIFSNLKNINIHGYLSNGKIQFSNTIINANLILLNALMLFSQNLNPEVHKDDNIYTLSFTKLKNHFSDDLIEDIITTFEYYNIILRDNDKDLLFLNTDFFNKKQEISIEIIKKTKYVEEVVSTPILQVETKNDMIESYIIKLIKTKKISKLEIQGLVEAKCGFKIKESIFKACMTRLFDLDYYMLEENMMVYVP